MLNSLYWILPELLLACLVLLLTLCSILDSKGSVSQWIFVTGVVVIAGVSAYQHVVIEDDIISVVFNTSFIEISRFTLFWKVILGVSMGVIGLFTLGTPLKPMRGEYYILLTSVLLGAFLLVMSRHLLMLVISLEVISLSSYLLAGLSREGNTIESAVKYFLFGAAATAVTIYGISWFYGLSGTVSLWENSLTDLTSHTGPAWIPVFVVVLISSGILFKVAVAPWHIWVPDVYQETPTPVVAMFSVIPKIAGFAFLTFWVKWLNWPTESIAVLAVLTMSVGNFAALRQKNVKRMMGYSSIAHSGFLLMALLYPMDVSALFFYAVIYALSNLGTFLMINYYERRYRLRQIDEFDGYFKISPYFGILLLVLMISLTGLPPTAGFTAKLFLFSLVASEYQASGLPILLFVLVFGILNTVVSLAYYLRIPYRMIFKPLTSSVIVFKKYSLSENLLCLFLVLAVLMLFFKPQWLMGWINSSSFAY
jgi:NADH-quinone oxidoreductase subunit N